ncbi:phage antirepressor KilAC domain-containing protein [Brevibacillus porteri]|uniref:phage antirepressor KilAC domain-containing protein n=1 Tax=Brevibacillus porteri TaxID=2126350 RepID=UPI003D20285E
MNKPQIIEFENQRVLTTTQLAESYGADRQQVSYNFNHNKSRYAQGKHYFSLEGDEKRDFLNRHEIHDGSKNASILYLWTEKGAWMHAKSLNTDKAWLAYETLVDDYYRVKQASITDNPQQLIALALVEAQKIIENKDQQIAIMQPKADFFDQVADSKDAIDIGTAAKVLKIPGYGRNNLFEFLRNEGILMGNNQPFQRYIDAGYFRVIEQKYNKPDGSTNINIKTLVYQKGLDFIRRVIIQKNGGPLQCQA